MKRALAVLVTLVLGGVAQAAPVLPGKPQGFGIGIVAGDPTGLSFAWRPSDAGLIQAAAGWSTVKERVHFNVDYLVNLTIIAIPDAPRLRLPVYVGAGARVRLGDDQGKDEHGSAVGVRVPVGITLLPTDTRVDIFFEIAPAVLLLPETDFGVDAGMGARIYF